MLDRWGAVLARRPVRVLVAAAVVVLLAGGYGAGVFGSLSQGGFDDPSSEGYQELAAERAALGNQSIDVVAIYSSKRLEADDPAFERAVKQVVRELPKDAVARVLPYYQAPPRAGLVSADGHYAQVQISLAGTSQDDFLTHYDDIAPVLQSTTLTTDLAGPYAIYDDVNAITSKDAEHAELISLPAVVILALIIFGSVVAALMPTLVGLGAMLGALAVVRLIAEFTDVSIFSVNVISLLGIGLAIDYALFVVSRFREELALLPDDAPDAAAVAIRRTMSTAGRTVLFSALTVAGAMASLLLFPQAFLRSMGYGGIAAVLVAMLAALTILPAVLRLLGRRVEAGRLPWRRGPRGGVEGERWARLAHAVMRRPVVVATVTVVLLLLVASPFLGARFGSVDYRVLPEDSAAHRASVLLDTEFGSEVSTANLLLQGTKPRDVSAFANAAGRVRGVESVDEVAEKDGTVLLRAVWKGGGQTERSQRIVRDLRDVDPASGSVLVGGISADTVDLIDSVADHLPWMGLVVVVVMFVLLFVAFGSVVLPLKAVVMNLFSITASFGVVTWIFSDGHLSDLIGFTPQGYLDATNPILMLAILFGLSMDYEVFLLSRVREEWDRTGDNEAAVAVGVQRTGRIITSAALLLAVVIGAFSTSGIVFMKMLGIGMLVALLIDATVVRALLVPATMKLLGRWNWWAPAPMARWWEKYGFREGGDAHADTDIDADGAGSGGTEVPSTVGAR
ncbi:MMPL family transporter [Nocardioides acrostichi]|uniref:MMPL family transporter n=1 Tax=Nocardioides acrostichi TaxID=2784339 RepID=A0A930YCH4_9ACTN|nr:MMPL family transporter [Nocardioides acrostichi]MBF4163493.1 MMPL family transporter [Nocardioides acrostichi]